jgi:hypothetical protein
MKNIIIMSLTSILFSCNGQNSKNDSIIKAQTSKKINMQTFDIDRYNKNKDQEGVYSFKDIFGNHVKEEGDSETGYVQNRKLSDKLFYVEYKEYYGSGKIKVIGKTLLDNTAVGVPVDLWQYFDENGNLEKEIDENKKFGKFGPNELLKFLESKKIIDIKTGEGWYLKDNRNSFTISFDDVDKIWEVVSSEGSMVRAEESLTRQALKVKYYYLINSNTGDIQEKK